MQIGPFTLARTKSLTIGQGLSPLSGRGGQRIQTTPASTGLDIVDSVGLAVCLMRTDVVADLPRPWFRHGLTATGGDLGEDITFCRALTQAGHAIWIDHDLSQEIGHIGQYTYRPAAAQVAV